MGLWQALFGKKAVLSPRKRHRKPSLGWQTWALIAGAIIVGAILAIVMSEISRSLPRSSPSQQSLPAEAPQDR